MNMFWRYKNSDDGIMLATWKGVLYAILDETQDRALTEILRIRKIPGHPRRTLFICTFEKEFADKFYKHKSFIRDPISGFC